jgi:hypothetical protein
MFMGKRTTKTTVEIPDTLFRKARAAAERGISLKDLLTDAVREHLQRSSDVSAKNGVSAPAPPPVWMSAFGGLRSPHKETRRINRVLEQEFEQRSLGICRWRRTAAQSDSERGRISASRRPREKCQLKIVTRDAHFRAVRGLRILAWQAACSVRPPDVQ